MRFRHDSRQGSSLAVGMPLNPEAHIHVRLDHSWNGGGVLKAADGDYYRDRPLTSALRLPACFPFCVPIYHRSKMREHTILLEMSLLTLSPQLGGILCSRQHHSAALVPYFVALTICFAPLLDQVQRRIPRFYPSENPFFDIPAVANVGIVLIVLHEDVTSTTQSGKRHPMVSRAPSL